MKQITDRLGYAFIGALLGAVVGVVLWFLYDLGASHRRWAPEIHLGLKQWCLYSGAAGAVLGLLFGPGVGSVAGSASAGIYRYESRTESGFALPRWVVVVLVMLLMAGGLAWRTFRA